MGFHCKPVAQTQTRVGDTCSMEHDDHTASECISAGHARLDSSSAGRLRAPAPARNDCVAVVRHPLGGLGPIGTGRIVVVLRQNPPPRPSVREETCKRKMMMMMMIIAYSGQAIAVSASNALLDVF